MQATYKLRDDGVFEPRFLSCFAGTFECTDDSVCVLDLVKPELNFYHCCCKENYCNAHGVIDFPSVVPPNSTTKPSETSTTASPVFDATVTPNSRMFETVCLSGSFLCLLKLYVCYRHMQMQVQEFHF